MCARCEQNEDQFSNENLLRGESKLANNERLQNMVKDWNDGKTITAHNLVGAEDMPFTNLNHGTFALAMQVVGWIFDQGMENRDLPEGVGDDVEEVVTGWYSELATKYTDAFVPDVDTDCSYRFAGLISASPPMVKLAFRTAFQWLVFGVDAFSTDPQVEYNKSNVDFEYCYMQHDNLVRKIAALGALKLFTNEELDAKRSTEEADAFIQQVSSRIMDAIYGAASEEPAAESAEASENS